MRRDEAPAPADRWSTVCFPAITPAFVSSSACLRASLAFKEGGDAAEDAKDKSIARALASSVSAMAVHCSTGTAAGSQQVGVSLQRTSPLAIRCKLAANLFTCNHISRRCNIKEMSSNYSQNHNQEFDAYSSSLHAPVPPRYVPKLCPAMPCGQTSSGVTEALLCVGASSTMNLLQCLARVLCLER